MSTVTTANQLHLPKDVRGYLLQGMSLNQIAKKQFPKKNQLRSNNDYNAALRYDEWKEIDDQAIQIVRTRLDAIDDLLDRDLTQTLGGLGTTISEYEQVSDMTPADVNMSPQAQTDNDTQNFGMDGVPIPIVHKDFQLDVRRLLASQGRGDGLDVSQANTSSRKVAEASETMLVKGWDLTVGGYTIYGYTNHPDRITGNAEGDFSTDIGNIYPTFQSMVKELNNKGFTGPYVAYVAPEQYEEMRDVYDDGSGDSVLQRIEEQFPEIEEVKKLHELDDGNLVMVQLTSDVVDLAVAEAPTTVEWDSPSGFKVNFKVMAAWAPRIKTDYEGTCGVVHYTGA